MRELLRRLGYYLRRGRFERELEEEMAYHRDLSGEKRFGNSARLKEESREAWSWPTLDSAARDLRYGARRLVRSPGFTVVALLSLGLGIGANTAVFQLVNAVRLRSLPVPDPQRIVEIRIPGGNGGFGRNSLWNSLTYPMWEQIRDNAEGFEGTFAWARTDFELGTGEERRSVQGAWVSGDAFGTLGVGAAVGRMLGPEDDRPGCPAVAVVGYGLWQRGLGGGRSVVGSELTVRGRPVTVVGVAPRGFFGVEVGREDDVFMPFCVAAQWTPGLTRARDWFWLGVLGRLDSGWSARRAGERLRVASRGWFEEVAPTGYGAAWMEQWSRFRLTAEPRPSGISVLRETYGSSLWFLMGITALVLLMACANLANLMLARSASRGREIAVRMAIGASRARIVWQLFWESLLLALGGAAVGVGLAGVMADVVLRFIRGQMAFVELAVPFDWRVFGFVGGSTAAVCLALMLSTGMLATRSGRRARVAAACRSATTEGSGLRIQRPLIALQVALSLVLVTSSLLFVRSFRNLFTLDAGFRQEGTAYHLITGLSQESDDVVSRLRAVLDAARTAPGVSSAATTTHIPFSGMSSWLAVQARGEQDSPSRFTWVSPAYFETMEIPLLAGRDVADSDGPGSRPVIVVNETFVRHYFDGENPVGRTVRSLEEPGYPEVEYEIVGVVGDTRYGELRDEVPPIAYAPDQQIPDPGRNPIVVTHSDLPVPDVALAVGAALARVEPGARIDRTIDVRALAIEGMSSERMLAWLAGFFGVLALGLAAIGLYGVVSCVVEGRRGEIGIRMALGASSPGVAWMVVRQVAGFVGLGLLVGAALVLALSGAARSLLVELEPNDPLTLVTSSALLLAVGVWAAAVPARRASRIDPKGVLD